MLHKFESVENNVWTYHPRCSIKIRYYLRAAPAGATVVYVETTHAFGAATPVQIIRYIAEITHNNRWIRISGQLLAIQKNLINAWSKLHVSTSYQFYGKK